MNLALALALDPGICVGFSGTQDGLNTVQRDKIHSRLVALFKGKGLSTFRHGDCVGADAQVALIARFIGYDLTCHPPTDPKKRAYIKSTVTLKPEPYLKRNRNIVLGSDVMLIGPKEMSEQLRSGTWSTYRYSIEYRKQVSIFYPDGTIGEENG